MSGEFNFVSSRASGGTLRVPIQSHNISPIQGVMRPSHQLQPQNGYYAGDQYSEFETEEYDAGKSRNIFARSTYFTPAYFCGYVRNNLCYIAALLAFVGGIAFIIMSLGTNMFPPSSTPAQTVEILQPLEAVIGDTQVTTTTTIGTAVKGEKPQTVDTLDDSRTHCPPGMISKDHRSECVLNFLYPNPVDVTLMETEMNPCENFYEYACGSYSEGFSSESVDVTFSYLGAKNIAQVQQIIASALPGSKLESFFAACVDHGSRGEPEYNSSEVLQKLLQMVDTQFVSRTDFPRILGMLAQYDVLLPLSFTMELDPCHARRSIPTFVRSGLSNDGPDPSSVGNMIHRTSIKTRFMSLLSRDRNKQQLSEEYAKMVLEIESRLAAYWTSEEEENIGILEYADQMSTFNKGILAFSTLKDIMQPFSLPQFIRSFVGNSRYDSASTGWWKLPDNQEVWVFNDVYMKGITTLMYDPSIPFEYWSTYLKHCVLFSFENVDPTLSPDRFYTYHHGYDAEHALPWKRPPRFSHPGESLAWDVESRCAQITAAYLPVVLDQYFVEENRLGKFEKKRVLDLAESIRSQLVEELTDHGNLQAARKVAEITIIAGTPPDWPPDRSGLVITQKSHSDNVFNVRRFHQEFMMDRMYPGRVLTPSDLVDMPLYIPNAYYQPQLNAIIINAGIISAPVFNSRYDDVANSARLGVFIAHELVHSIDPTGIFFDDQGSFNPWMNERERQEYSERELCIISLYSKKTRYGNMHDGERTVRENIADIAGFRTAYNSVFGNYKEGGGSNIKIPTLSNNNNNNNAATQQSSSSSTTSTLLKKEFFLTYAQTWCRSTNKSAERSFIRQSVHSTPEMRVNNVVMQSPFFREVFECKPSDRATKINKCPLF